MCRSSCDPCGGHRGYYGHGHGHGYGYGRGLGSAYGLGYGLGYGSGFGLGYGLGRYEPYWGGDRYFSGSPYLYGAGYRGLY